MSRPNEARSDQWWLMLALILMMVLSFHSLCNLVYGCGCQPLWAGALSHCNIHISGAAHCPFCVSVPRALPALGPPLLAIYLLRRRMSAVHLLLAGGMVYVASAALFGLVWGKLDDYPTWFGLRI